MKNSLPQCEAVSMREGRSIPHMPKHIISWFYEHDENIGGDWAKAAIVVTRRYADMAMCECGQKLEIDRNGNIRLPAEGSKDNATA